MPGIFISYRRDDAQGEALHLADDLKERFPEQVFMDVTGIEPGRDFRKVIDAAVSSCAVLIVVIGRAWLTAADAQGRRRLDDPKDFVRLETGGALARDIAVIPVLVQGAAMPSSEQLPGDLEPLAWRNAFELRHTRWSSDLELLVDALRRIPGLAAPAPSPSIAPVPAPAPASAPSPSPEPSRRSGVLLAAVALAAAGGGFAWWKSEAGPQALADAGPVAPAAAPAPVSGPAGGASRPAPARKAAPAPLPAPKPVVTAATPAAPPPPAPEPAPPARPAPVAYAVTRDFLLSGGEPGTQMSPRLQLVAGFETRGALAFELELPNSCSPVRLHVSVDGRTRLVTPFFQGYSRRIEVGDVGEGSHQLRLQPEGKAEGCNAGTLGSWGGTLTLHLTR